MELAFEDMHGHDWSVLGLNRGRGLVSNFFRCSNDFVVQKVYFSWLMGVCVGLIMLAAWVYLKVHKIDNFFKSDFGICIISLLVMSKY
jgi:hypothetical protein